MASIKSTIELYDRFSAPLLKVASAVSKTEQVMAHMNEQMSRSAGSEKFGEARRQVEETTAAVSKLTGGLSGAAASAGEHIQGGAQAQAKLNHELEIGAGLAKRFGSMLKTAFGAYMGVQTVKNIMAASDQLTLTTARLEMMNDGLQSGDALTEMIYKAAQNARGSFTDMADVVARFGNNAKDAFSSTREVVRFSELVQKQMTIAGAGTQEAANAMLQLSQALGSGVLRGDELNSIFEQAPNLIRGIADYLDVPIGKIREMAAEGKLSAATVKAAVFAGADEINEKFNSMPQTFAQLWQSFKNSALWAFRPVLNQLNEIGNSAFQNIADKAITALSAVAKATSWVLDLMGKAAAAVKENWGTIGPIIGGVTLALLGLKAASLACTAVLAVQNGLQGAAAFMDSVRAASLQMSTGATFMATAAQYGFNAALLACPLTWIILAVIALVAVIFVLANALAKTTDVAMTGFGLIAGGIYVVIQWFKNLGLTVANIALGIWNAVSALAHNMVTAFSNAIANIKSVFYGLLATAMSVISQIAAALSKLPFVEFDASGLQAAAKGYAAKSAEAQASKGTYKDVGAAFSSGMGTFNTFAAGWEASAFSAGAAWGDGVMGKTSFGGAGMSMDDFGAGALASEVGNLADGVGGIANNAGGIADDVGGMAKDLSITKDELKYLRDIAEQEAVNRFTTAEIKVDMSGMQNIIDNSNDIDGIVDALTGAVGEAVEMIAAGVHV